MNRETWSSKVGLILAMAGGAVGLGNFIRFPLQAVSNGGGTFMIPYFVAFFLLGIPLMFVEWGLGRYGGSKGHATLPGIFCSIKNSIVLKLVGIFGIMIPLTIMSYYSFIESWTLGYSIFSLSGKFSAGLTPEQSSAIFSDYASLKSFWFPYSLFIFILFLNGYILYRGISDGIEKVAKILMPLLFIFAFFLVIRVFTLGTPDPSLPDNNIMNGLKFLWTPDFSKLGEFKIWLAAAGQIFFTLSLGLGAIACYASYVKKDDDIVTPAIATSTINEVAEVCLGGSIAIPLAVAFFGVTGAIGIASTAGLGFGFVTLPLLFAKLPFGFIFSSMWFILLFFAAITSSISMGAIVIAFFSEVIGFSKKTSCLITMGLVCLLGHWSIFVPGAIDEMDTLAGTYGLVLFALIEIYVWVYLFGFNASWEELVRGSRIKLWSGIKWIIAIITPLYLIIIISGWLYQDAGKVFFLKGVPEGEIIYRWLTRIILFITFIGLSLLTIKKKKNEK
ncbi:MAG: hypothetical protein A2381_08700 [Bdellovibrionales bacterium RIFOXYB1_FULL_37_110]|nr:MAG: hypothetical protein A2181_08895 [Bdellovibrionales bacterium RIFOXYA1_FULL_38_20]OFZ51224.1 MAG: hypothetical protein A2417_17460 [Bdellovibrionales bacterium RIFOXYC1_FULL_37_79]OFZ60920.1 MAG: hypothetical protein A2381_08700 [Bdellovibrionales bacterium RIFOXYB1_FULL_37_110]OFZ63664.1 MAG: hypothetical protein A2577_07820 [Bdellovibrionales bacterium RIFOXYD1_FULL_36_51]